MFILGAMEKAGKAEPERGRAYCYRCMRAQRMCVCELLVGCETETEIHILQHRRERQHAFGTVRLLKVGLRNLKLYGLGTDTGKSFPMPSGFPLDAAVLWPGEGARDLSELAPEERPKKLVVIDGTWDQAYRMFRDNAWLHGLTRYTLNPAEPSRYRIRKEPRRECLSTLESTVMALQILEPDRECVASLSDAFDRMNDNQVAAMAANTDGEARVKRRRQRAMRAVPEELLQNPASLVIVYGESAKPAIRRDKKTREVAQWSAIRFGEPESRFDAIVKTKVEMPSERFLDELGWDLESLINARPFDEVMESWKRFLRPGDVALAWNKGTMRLAQAHGLLSGGVMLKEVYGNVSKRNFGTLDDVVSYEKLEKVHVEGVSGRARTRLANSMAVTAFLRKWGFERIVP